MSGAPGGLATAGGEATAGTASPTPWERDDLAFPSDLFRSWMECMTRPAEFFGRVDPDAPFTRPLLFFLVFWVLGAGLAAVSTDPALGLWTSGYVAAADAAPAEAMVRLFWFFLSPFVGLIGLGLNVVFVHVGVRVFVPSAAPLHVTARGLCYVAAPQVLVIVPFLGSLLVFAWALVLAVIGMRELHGTTTGRAVAAVVVPQLLFWFLMIGTLLFLLLVAVALTAAAGAGA